MDLISLFLGIIIMKWAYWLFSSFTMSFLSQSRVPICPICNQMITRSNKEQSVNDRVERHILSGCKELVMAAPKKNKANRCTHKGCRRRELIPFVCPQCERVFCLRHRHTLDHECAGAAVTIPTTVAVHWLYNYNNILYKPCSPCSIILC